MSTRKVVRRWTIKPRDPSKNLIAVANTAQRLMRIALLTAPLFILVPLVIQAYIKLVAADRLPSSVVHLAIIFASLVQWFGSLELVYVALLILVGESVLKHIERAQQAATAAQQCERGGP